MRHRKWDILLILGLLLSAVILWFFLRPGGKGAYAVVTLHGKEIARYPLTESGSFTIGEEDYNILVISDGEAYISEANCGDHTCIRTGKISREGEQIVCLPHELVIEIAGGEYSAIDGSTQ